jgi:hypothetical protein
MIMLRIHLNSPKLNTVENATQREGKTLIIVHYAMCVVNIMIIIVVLSKFASVEKIINTLYFLLRIQV